MILPTQGLRSPPPRHATPPFSRRPIRGRRSASPRAPRSRRRGRSAPAAAKWTCTGGPVFPHGVVRDACGLPRRPPRRPMVRRRSRREWSRARRGRFPLGSVFVALLFDCRPLVLQRRMVVVIGRADIGGVGVKTSWPRPWSSSQHGCPCGITRGMCRHRIEQRENGGVVFVGCSSPVPRAGAAKAKFSWACSTVEGAGCGASLCRC